MAEFFPPSWFDCAYKDIVIEFLQHMAISGRVKKMILQEWAAHSGCKLTAEDITAVTGFPAGWI